MSNSALLKVYDGQEPDLCFGAAPGPGGVNSVGVGAGLTQTGSAANPIVNLGMAAVGDLLVGSGVNTGVVLGLGAAGDFLRVNLAGTDLEYAAADPETQNLAQVLAIGASANNVPITDLGNLSFGTGDTITGPAGVQFNIAAEAFNVTTTNEIELNSGGDITLIANAVGAQLIFNVAALADIPVTPQAGAFPATITKQLVIKINGVDAYIPYSLAQIA